jgi:hypothetical protein
MTLSQEPKAFFTTENIEKFKLRGPILSFGYLCGEDGYGRKLLRRLLKYAFEAGCRVARLSAQTPKAIQFYQMYFPDAKEVQLRSSVQFLWNN